MNITYFQVTDTPLRPCDQLLLENDRFEIYHRSPMSDVSMAISTDTDTDADVAGLSHLAVTGDPDVITADRDISECNQLL